VFIRTKKAGRYTYLQVVENRWRNGKVRQNVLGTLGRMDRLLQDGKMGQLLRSTAKFVDDALVVTSDKHVQEMTVRPQRIRSDLCLF